MEPTATTTSTTHIQRKKRQKHRTDAYHHDHHTHNSTWREHHHSHRQISFLILIHYFQFHIKTSVCVSAAVQFATFIAFMQRHRCPVCVKSQWNFVVQINNTETGRGVPKLFFFLIIFLIETIENIISCARACNSIRSDSRCVCVCVREKYNLTQRCNACMWL